MDEYKIIPVAAQLDHWGGAKNLPDVRRQWSMGCDNRLCQWFADK